MKSIYRVMQNRLIPLTERSLIPKGLVLHAHSEFISDYIRKNNRYFEFELLRFIRHRFDCSIYIDIGANIGNHVHYLQKFKATGFAFEPEYSNFNLLKANTSSAFVCKQIALSNSGSSEKLISYKDSRGNGYLSSTFNNVVNNWGDEVDYQEVEVRTLDSFGIVNCTFVKIDVEGSELKVLQGAIQTLAQSNPVVLIEIHADDSLSALNFPYTRLDIDTFFFRMGYKHHLAIDLTNHIYVKK